jgi:hypothetical protein
MKARTSVAALKPRGWWVFIVVLLSSSYNSDFHDG